MARSKKFNKLLNKINETEGSVFDTGGSFIAAGTISYERNEGGRGLYLDKKQIPISSVRSITPSFNNFRSLIFVDSKYNLGVAFD